MQAADRPADASPDHVDPPSLHRAFRDLHGGRLHGFALLLTLGDRRRAASLASDALAAASGQLSELRHPERAAAWLRRWVTRAGRSDDRRVPIAERLAVLHELGVGAPALAGLSGLTTTERAALIATAVERLDRRDVAQIVGQEGDRLDRTLRRARRRYLRGASATPDPLHGPAGPIRQRIAASAARTMS